MEPSKETPITASPPSPTRMPFLNTTHDVWLVRAGIATLLLISTLLFNFLLNSQPNLIPVDLTTFPPAPPLSCLTCHPETQISLPPQLPNSYLPCSHYVKPGSSTLALHNISRYFKTAVADSELLHAAQDAAASPLPPGNPKIAFLFVLRQKLPLVALWERFFAGASPDLYSIYTHPSEFPSDFPPSSVFHNTAIATKPVKRFDVTLADAVRRVVAFALLDAARANLWFVLVSEACVPVRGFPLVYNYLLNSSTSFVEAFSPLSRFKRWQTEPVFAMGELRKGEMWMAMHRRHAGMVVGDVTFYRKFKADCRKDCTLDEEYVQTLLHVLDPKGIANRSTTYVDWSNPKHGGSPLRHTAAFINSTLFARIQNRTENLVGQYMDSSDDRNHTMQTCVYNGQPHSPCFLFARKFSGDSEDVEALLQIPASVLGY